MNLRALVNKYALEEQDDAPVGTVRVRGQSRVQKQRNGEWLRLGPAKPEEIKPKKVNPSELAVPQSRKHSPAVPEIDIPVARKWVDSSPEMPESSTEDNFKDDKPRPQRKALHERILRTFLDHVDSVPPDKMPVAVLTMGGPISGKSAIIKNLTHDALFVRADPGTVALLIPEYQDAVKKNARNAPSIVQDEAAYVARSIIQKAVDDRKNVAIDAVGVDADAHSELLQDLQDRGYYTVLILTDLDRVDMIKRNIERGARTGRWVPPEAFALGKLAVKNFREVSEVADDTMRFDVRKAPKHVEEVLADLSDLFEDDEDDDEEEDPDEPAVKLTELRKRALEGLRKEKVRMSTLPEKYEKKEGVILAHYDDAHIQPLESDEDDDQDAEGPPQ